MRQTSPSSSPSAMQRPAARAGGGASAVAGVSLPNSALSPPSVPAAPFASGQVGAGMAAYSAPVDFRGPPPPGTGPGAFPGQSFAYGYRGHTYAGVGGEGRAAHGMHGMHGMQGRYGQPALPHSPRDMYGQPAYAHAGYGALPPQAAQGGGVGYARYPMHGSVPSPQYFHHPSHAGGLPTIPTAPPPLPPDRRMFQAGPPQSQAAPRGFPPASGSGRQ